MKTAIAQQREFDFMQLLRDAPAITIAEKLAIEGANVRAYDPVAMDLARPMLPFVEMCGDPYCMAENCDALMVVTEWNEFKQLDLAKLRPRRWVRRIPRERIAAPPPTGPAAVP